MKKIVVALGVMGVMALAAYTYGTMKEVKYMYSGPVTISVTGNGEVFAAPDIATFSFTVEAKEVDAATAQSKSAEAMNAILAYLKEQGVDEKDVKTTGYNLSPRYEYPQTVCTQWGCPPQGEPKVVGYTVDQVVSVKVRDTKKAGELLSGVGGKGAMNVSSLSFTIDDEEKLKSEAREKAITDAKAKAEVLAKNLGVRLVRMNGYWEEMGGTPMPYGMGGAEYGVMSMKADAARVSPELPSGENKITSQVNISYEVR